jgi:hypothetical protein
MLHALWLQTHDLDATLQLYNSGLPTGDARYVARVRAAARTHYAYLVLGNMPNGSTVDPAQRPAPRGTSSTDDAHTRTSAHFYTEGPDN